MRMAGIPCRVVIGYAIGVNYQSWETVNHANSNHTWNEALVDGRWVIMGSTWDSINKYEKILYKNI
ncbi:transglutaminase domain-containing protein [Clostridium estertheticum]|nr:transglutaminase domain-containing protein [Clostridium estertheticum]